MSRFVANIQIWELKVHDILYIECVGVLIMFSDKLKVGGRGGGEGEGREGELKCYIQTGIQT